MRELLQQALMGDYPQLVAAVRKYLAAPMPEPVAYRSSRNNGKTWIITEGDPTDLMPDVGGIVVPLYAAPPAAPADSQPCATKPVVSQNAVNLTNNADMVMVPREPTPEMRRAGVALHQKHTGHLSEVITAVYRAMIAAAPPAAPAPVVPIDMVLHCPKCGLQHIDAADPWVAKYGEEVCKARGFDLWTNPPHKSHLCRREDGGCGHIWRPADVPTNGVAALRTKGKSDMPPALAVSEKATVDCVTTIEVLRARIAMLESAAPVVQEPQPGVLDPDCNYMAPKGKVCNKCGRIHRGIGGGGK